MSAASGTVGVCCFAMPSALTRKHPNLINKGTWHFRKAVVLAAIVLGVFPIARIARDILSLLASDHPNDLAWKLTKEYSTYSINEPVTQLAFVGSLFLLAVAHRCYPTIASKTKVICGIVRANFENEYIESSPAIKRVTNAPSASDGVAYSPTARPTPQDLVSAGR